MFILPKVVPKKACSKKRSVFTPDTFAEAASFPQRHARRNGSFFTPDAFAEAEWRADSVEFCHRARFEAAGILCVFQGFKNAGMGQKDRCSAVRLIQDGVRIKRERGESDIHPALAPVFACERYTAVSFTRVFAD